MVGDIPIWVLAINGFAGKSPAGNLNFCNKEGSWERGWIIKLCFTVFFLIYVAFLDQLDIFQWHHYLPKKPFFCIYHLFLRILLHGKLFATNVCKERESFQICSLVKSTVFIQDKLPRSLVRIKDDELSNDLLNDDDATSCNRHFSLKASGTWAISIKWSCFCRCTRTNWKKQCSLYAVFTTCSALILLHRVNYSYIAIVRKYGFQRMIKVLFSCFFWT